MASMWLAAAAVLAKTFGKSWKSRNLLCRSYHLVAAASRGTLVRPASGIPFAPRNRTGRCSFAPNGDIRPMSRPRRVLLIDDNIDAAESLAQLLSLSGHDARTAVDGTTGLRVAAEFNPEVVFCDLGLPGMSGYEVAASLRALPTGKDLILVALTGYGQPSDREKTAQAGFDAHLVKPVDPAVIESFLDDYAET